MNETGPKWSCESETAGAPEGEPRGARFEPPLMPQGPALREMLARSVPGARATAIEFLDRGLAQANYRLELAAAVVGAAWAGPGVLRLRLSRSDEAPRREGMLGDLLHERCPGLAPRLLSTETADMPEWHRRSLFTWLEGEPIDEFGPGPPGEEVAGLAGESYVAELARALVGLHAIAPPGFGPLDVEGKPVGREDDAGRNGRRRAEARFENSAHAFDAERLRLLREAFERLCAPLCNVSRVRPALIHAGLSPGHVLVRRDPDTGLTRLGGLVGWGAARAADPAEEFAALRLEWQGRLAAPARAVERVYLELTTEAKSLEAIEQWERRVAVALVSRLLEARIVARRRLAATTLAEIDQQLDLLLLNGAGGA